MKYISINEYLSKNPRFKVGKTLVFTYNGRQVSGEICAMQYMKIQVRFQQGMAKNFNYSTKSWLALDQVENQSVMDIMAEQIANNGNFNDPF
jgi:hypothetical protein